ncbi:EAL domain-containing protein [Faunimonas pinastri]|uniref:EAL domain-containing protein n=1 Tax=Faunimonas pinastri TaxID=1855383 RepID=UPI0027144C77|nr:EAL domain-containing protein [Faunimonas pinastri]
MKRLLVLLFLVGLSGHAVALEAISVPLDAKTIDLTHAVERHSEQTDKVQVSTAPGADGIVRRIEVHSSRPDGPSDWAVFALSNPSDEQIDRLLVAPHYQLIRSGVLWPDLGSQRVVAVTPSEGFPPEQVQSGQADIYRITLDPGAVITFVVELHSEALPQLHLWQPDAYEDSVNSYTLYHGIVLGIAGLLALFLSVLFVVKGTAMFPATAALAWAVFAYTSIDFGFWNRIFALAPANEQFWRGGTEVLLAGALVVFLYTYLHLHRWHVRYSHIAILWLLGLIVAFGILVVDPSVAAGLARMSLGLTAVVGLAVILFLALRNFDRAIMLIPAWAVLVFWVVGSWLAVTGKIHYSAVQPAIAGGLVLIVMLIAFTIMQHAFAGGALAQGLISDAEQKALAMVGAGDAVWDWDVSRDRVEASRQVEHSLGYPPGGLEGPARHFLSLLHPGDQERFTAVLDAVVTQRRGRINQAFRLRSADGHYLWFTLRARPIVGTDGEVMRCTGTISDINDAKIAEERLMQDAIHDNLTGLPNRQLFLDRLQFALARSRAEGVAEPTVLVFLLDRFKSVNERFGHSVGDSVMLAVGRRLSRLLREQDTLARLQGDAFAAIILSETSQDGLDAVAAEMMSALKTAISVGEHDIFLSASVGMGFTDPQQSAEAQLQGAETAAYNAKRQGGDQIETYSGAAATNIRASRFELEAELRKALDGGGIELAYQPIIKLSDRLPAGFEALLRWEHPTRGKIPPSEFIPVAEESGLIVQLGLFAMERAARELAGWQAMVEGENMPFVSINVSSQQLLRHDLINDVKAVMTRTGVAPGTLKLEITETMVMQNPEYASKVLARIKEMGAGLSLDDFGTGYSSLAYLERFPFDTIKIDRSFVHCGESQTRPIILRSVIALAHELGMEVIAEGAETESDTEQLRQLGCEYVQGFYYGRPMTAQMVQQLVRRPVARAS